MSEKKAYGYARVGNAEQLGETTDNRVFLYCRQSYDNSHFMNQQQEQLLRHCSDKGYRAEGSMAVVATAKDEKENMLRLAELLKADGNTRNLLEVLEQLRTANLNLAEPEHGEYEEPDESPRIQM